MLRYINLRYVNQDFGVVDSSIQCFCHYIHYPVIQSNPHLVRINVHLPSLTMNIVAVVCSYLDEYNLVSKAPMHLVMFKFAIEHVSRVARVLKQDNGHVLLVGMYY